MEANSYLDFAENDFLFLNKDYEEGRIGNIMCSTAQSICERYLKHIIDKYVRDVDNTVILRTHSLKMLKRFIIENVPKFMCNWDIVLQADGYYFSMRYPGDSSYMADKSDVDMCWSAVVETRNAVQNFISQNSSVNSVDDISHTDSVLKALRDFE